MRFIRFIRRIIKSIIRVKCASNVIAKKNLNEACLSSVGVKYLIMPSTFLLYSEIVPLIVPFMKLLASL